MSQFTLQQGVSKELEGVPRIKEFSLIKTSTIQLDSFKTSTCDSLRLFYIVDGKFEWTIGSQFYTLYPGDLVRVLPQEEIGGSKGYLGIGTLYSLGIKVTRESSNLISCKWSTLSKAEGKSIYKIISLSRHSVLKMEKTAELFRELYLEIVNREIGYVTRVSYLIDNLLISIARQSMCQTISRRDFPQTFMKLEHTLRQSLAHQWTVEEMAAMVGLGTTAFTEKVKSYTGFSPVHYLINIRISEAIKLLKRPDINFTSIALETGFYSSQHFSTTFKKLTGYTPGEFRKKYIPSTE